VWILWGSKIALSHWQSQSPSTQGCRYRAARDKHEWWVDISPLTLRSHALLITRSVWPRSSINGSFSSVTYFIRHQFTIYHYFCTWQCLITSFTCLLFAYFSVSSPNYCAHLCCYCFIFTNDSQTQQAYSVTATITMQSCTHARTHAHTHTRLTAVFPGLPRWAGIRKVKPIWTLLKQETVSGSSISWAICKSAPRSRQITTSAPHHSFFTGWMPFLLPNQQCQSTEGIKMQSI